jgi:hypothetical protein
MERKLPVRSLGRRAAASHKLGERIMIVVSLTAASLRLHHHAARFLLLLVVLLGCSAQRDEPERTAMVSLEAVTPVYSDLWGQSGERWTPQSRLPNFSFAGYRTGTSAIPTPPIVANVKSFGAVGDGITDDSQAFLNAIAASSNGAISIPAGRYKITKVLKIGKSNLVLRGAGIGTTTIVLPNSLTDLLGSAPAWAGNSGAWSWAGGFLWLEGRDNGAKLANVTGSALRGAKNITVDTTAGITVGATIRLLQFNNDGSLGRHLHAEQSAAGSFAPLKLVDFATKVTAISGNTLTLERPLQADVRSVWTPQVHAFAPTVQETGIEDLSIEFPNTTYAGHLVERGYNAIYLDGVANCWIRNVTIWDADSGITTASQTDGISRFCTIDNVRLANRFRPSSGISGHHGIALEGPRDMLVSRFNFDKQFVHDLTIDTVSSGNVFSAGRGVNMNFDHHRVVPYENLFTDIDVGVGDTLWIGSRNGDSGNADGGPPSAARSTVWNIRASNAQGSLPNWPQLNVIGMLRYPTQKTGNLWVEQLDPAALSPSNLYLAQLAYRQDGNPPTLTTISVTPSTATVSPSATQQFVATAYDQFGSPMNPQPSVAWTVSGGGTINSTGRFSAGASTGGPFVVTASSSGKSGTASVTVSAISETTLSAQADAYVRDGGSATTNYGSNAALEVKEHDAGWNRRVYVKFDLSSLAGAVSGAKLRLYGNLAGTDPQLSVGAFSAGSSWTESGLTWNTQPSVGTSALSTLVITGTTPRWNEWDVTAYVQAEKSAGRNVVSLLLKSATVSATLADFDSKEAGSTAPQLVVSLSGGINQPPSVATAASASPSTVTGTTTSLSALGADDGGAASLTYTWAATGSPPASVAFSPNATNAAKNSTATFSRAGNYSLQVTIADAQGQTAVSSVGVAVNRSTTAITVLPANASIAPNASQQFTASAADQFGVVFSPAPVFTWAASGGGTISSSGLFSSGSAPGGPFTITASSAGKNGTANLTVSSGGSSSVALAALGDAFVRDGGYASTSYGSSSALEVKSHDAGWNRLSFLKFDLTSISRPITQVKLRLYGSVSLDALTLQAFGVANTSWLESAITWNNQPATSSGALAQLIVSSTTPQWYDWDITAYAQTEKNAGRHVIVVAIKSATFGASFAGFTSREGGANAPQLVVTMQ